MLNDELWVMALAHTDTNGHFGEELFEKLAIDVVISVTKTWEVINHWAPLHNQGFIRYLWAKLYLNCQSRSNGASNWDARSCWVQFYSNCLCRRELAYWLKWFEFTVIYGHCGCDRRLWVVLQRLMSPFRRKELVSCDISSPAAFLSSHCCDYLLEPDDTSSN